MKRAGKVNDMEARAIQTVPSSSGCRIIPGHCVGILVIRPETEPHCEPVKLRPGEALRRLQSVLHRRWCDGGTEKAELQPTQRPHRARPRRYESWWFPTPPQN